MPVCINNAIPTSMMLLMKNGSEKASESLKVRKESGPNSFDNSAFKQLPAPNFTDRVISIRLQKHIEEVFTHLQNFTEF